MTRRPQSRSGTPLRLIAARSAALLREAVNPAKVLAWLCPRCGQWVPPRRFSIAAGLCRSCTTDLDPKGRHE